jgi:hypothetical protein
MGQSERLRQTLVRKSGGSASALKKFLAHLFAG